MWPLVTKILTNVFKDMYPLFLALFTAKKVGQL